MTNSKQDMMPLTPSPVPHHQNHFLVVWDVSRNSCSNKCSDRTRISILKDELFRLLRHEQLQHFIILIFDNKQDIKDAMTPAEITDTLSFHNIKDHDCHIQACSALSGEGLYNGLRWRGRGT
ncbi:unnamed protein product [Lupinus luteus]|uniref:ADP-ribosylation factor n=1 Tax=Lupinus luteus TaxID=3873 RepID=A0AAV1XHS5_LUPLU